MLNLSNQNSSSLHNIDYYGSPVRLRELGFKNAGNFSYVISSVDSKDKYSEQFKDCTGIVAIGLDKKTGEEISFLSHQDPEYFLLKHNNNSEQFLNDLADRLRELKDRSIQGTLDAVIVGGHHFKTDDHSQKKYTDSIELLSKQIAEILGFNPAVLTGPKEKFREESFEDKVFLDNKERRVYIMRPRVGNSTTQSYSPTHLNTQRDKWLNDKLVS